MTFPNRMKILHIIDSEGLYGAEIMLLNLMEEQKRMKLQPVLLSINDLATSNSAIVIESMKRGFPTVKMPIEKGFSLTGSLNIVKFAKENLFSLIHSHGYKVDILLGILPKVIRSKPILTTVHGFTGVKLFSKIWWYEAVDKFMLHRLDAVVQVKSYIDESKKCAWQGRRNNYTVYNGIPELVFDLSSMSHSDPVVSDFCKDGFVIGTICRLSEEKGLDHLIDAMHLLLSHKVNYKAIVIGEGPQKDLLQLKINNYGLAERILLAGYREHAYRYLPLFDVFVLPSLTEGLPIVVLEAMQAETPIIATRVGGIPEVLDNGRLGILIEPGNAEALADAIALVPQNLKHFSEICKDAHNVALEKYSSRRMAENYIKVYEAILEKWGN